MSIKSTDLFMYRAIKTAIEDIRKHDYVMDDVVGDAVEDPLLSEIYGQKEVDKFRLFMSKNIHVDLEYNIDMAKLPAVAIKIGGGQEDASKTGDAIGDGYLPEQVDPPSLRGNFKSPQVVLGPVTPLSYDSTTGKVTFPSNVSLSNVYDGMMLFDEVNKKSYPISVVLDDQNLMIEIGSQPNFNMMTVRTMKNAVQHTHRSYFCHEEVTLGVYATEAAEMIYMFSLLMYIIGRYRLTLFNSKNFRVTTVVYGPIFKAIEDPNMVFAREITLSGQVEHTYIERTDELIQGNKPDVRIDSMPKTPAALAKQAKDQGWSSPEDQ